jgi:hypothetical protein
MATQKLGGQKLLKKLTIRTAVGSKAEILAYAQTGKESEKATTGAPVPILRVMGAVSTFKPGESDFGPYVSLIGQFKATNLQTGETFQNISKCLLPSVVSDMIAAALAQGVGRAIRSRNRRGVQRSRRRALRVRGAFADGACRKRTSQGDRVAFADHGRSDDGAQDAFGSAQAFGRCARAASRCVGSCGCNEEREGCQGPRQGLSQGARKAFQSVRTLTGP